MKGRRHLICSTSVLCAVLISLAIGAPSASAKYRHSGPYASFGSDGTSATTIPGVESLAYQQTAKRLYVLTRNDPRAIHAFSLDSPGAFTPLGGSFPLAVNSGFGDPDLAVDNTTGPSASNLYYAPDGPLTEGFDSTGAPLPGFPVDSATEVCGAAVDNEGNLWVGNYGASTFEKFANTGGPALAKYNTGNKGRPCHVAVDLSNNDVYVSIYGESTWRYTAASGYSGSSAMELPTGFNARIAVNPSLNRLYAATDRVRVFDTTDGSLIEEFGGGNYRGIAVESSTDTVFLANANTGKVEEWRGGNVPSVVTGEPVGNSEVSGSVLTDGAGDVIECYFEFGTTTNYGSKEDCSPSAPYVSDQDVTADLPDLTSDTVYHYRLVAGNANGTNVGADMEIVPHNVDNLTTLPATGLQRTAATLRGSFTGIGFPIRYYFEWGLTSEYGSQSADPPYTSAGSPVGPTSVSFGASGLQAGSTYHYRIAAESPLGIAYGEDRTFTTLSPVQSLNTEAASDVARQGATLNGSYLGDGDETTYHFEYGTTTDYGTTTGVQSAGSPNGSTPISSTVGGLQIDTTYHYRVVASNGLGTSTGPDRTFTTKSAVLGLATKPATDISLQAITLNGEFIGTAEDTSYYFEWGPTTAYGNLTAAPPGSSAGAPVGATSLSAEITDFQGFFTYHYRVVASNELGVAFGSDQTFSTPPSPPPALSGTTASGVTPSSVLFSAKIDPNRTPTKYRFEYGPTSAYGHSSATQAVPWFADGEPVSSSATDLRPGTTYHYRLVATSLGGTTASPDQTFSTPGRPTIGGVGIGAIAQRSAQPEAVVSPSSLTTTVRFQYGTSRAYGSWSEPIALGAGTSGQPVGARLSELAPGTTYHFRVVAQNGLGTAQSADRTFTTLPGKASPAKPPKCRKGTVRKRGKCVKKKRPKRRRAGR